MRRPWSPNESPNAYKLSIKEYDSKSEGVRHWILADLFMQHKMWEFPACEMGILQQLPLKKDNVRKGRKFSGAIRLGLAELFVNSKRLVGIYLLSLD